MADNQLIMKDVKYAFFFKKSVVFKQGNFLPNMNLALLLKAN